MELKAFVTNLGKYNEGYLIGEWVSFPIDEDEQEELFDRIGINDHYEEIFLTDWECDLDLDIGEYTSLAKMNEYAEMIENVEDYQIPALTALINDGGYSLEHALDHLDDCITWSNCYDMEDVARAYADETGLLSEIPENLQYYFDFESFGRDMGLEGEFYFTNDGDCIEVIR